MKYKITLIFELPSFLISLYLSISNPKFINDMAGEGSIQGMITSLKNNKMILGRRRTTIFGNKKSFSELKAIYAKKHTPKEKEISKEYRQAIRNQIIAENKRIAAIKITLFSIVGLLTLFIAIKFILRTATYDIESETIIDHKKGYEVAIELGRRNLKHNESFFAIGYFKQALKHLPNDSIAVRLLVKSYYQLCNGTMEGCEGIKKELDSLKKEYSFIN